MNDYEKLGAFYLGKLFDMQASSSKDELLLYEAKDFRPMWYVCVDDRQRENRVLRHHPVNNENPFSTEHSITSDAKRAGKIVAR